MHIHMPHATWPPHASCGSAKLASKLSNTTRVSVCAFDCGIFHPASGTGSYLVRYAGVAHTYMLIEIVSDTYLQLWGRDITRSLWHRGAGGPIIGAGRRPGLAAVERWHGACQMPLRTSTPATSDLDLPISTPLPVAFLRHELSWNFLGGT